MLHVRSVSLEEIRNFVAVNERLLTAGQPTEQQLRELAASGVELVINLGLLDPRYCLPDEAASVARLGLSYRHLPVDFTAPTLEDFSRFELLMAEAGARRTFVHCAANYRVSCFMALYGERRLGWSREQALGHVARVWAPNPTWQAFMTAVQSLPSTASPDPHRPESS